ncbi:hypothetical protein DRF60_16770 [Chryseobacterium elymi]|uniref:Uncharacterized protein n=1 Tax=Chryseobacterium elymi TaxID=395936 RepID=A0A3D9D9W1_9FLAO|nr:hypothetical protein DRF60_16770 [Chryseobacterium elymi]
MVNFAAQVNGQWIDCELKNDTNPIIILNMYPLYSKFILRKSPTLELPNTSQLTKEFRIFA